MIGKYVLPLLALIGLTIAVGAVIQGNHTAPLAPPVVQSPKVPFAAYVAGAGMIEASTENIAIGTPVSGIVTAIHKGVIMITGIGRPDLHGLIQRTRGNIRAVGRPRYRCHAHRMATIARDGASIGTRSRGRNSG